jgi:hypothetical protein
VLSKIERDILATAVEISRQNEELKQELREAEKAIDKALAELERTRQKLIEAKESREIVLALLNREKVEN